MRSRHTKLTGRPLRSRRGIPAAEEGSGAVLVLACCATLTLVLGASATLAGLVSDVHRARAAADLAALAAVSTGSGRSETGCSAAARVAALNGSTLSSCSVLADGSVLVGVQLPVTTSGVLGLGVLPGAVSARARAGLVGEPGR